MKLYIAPHFKRAGPIYLMLEYKSKLWQVALKNGQVRIYTTKPSAMARLHKDITANQVMTLDRLLNLLTGNENIVFDPLAVKQDESGRDYAELVETAPGVPALTQNDIPLVGGD